MDPEDPDNPDHSQNLIASSFYHFGHILKILSKSVHKFLSYLVHKQTDGQTQEKTYNLLGGDKNMHFWWAEREACMGQLIFRCALPTFEVHLQNNMGKVVKQNSNTC